jgi:hypothetical protein
LRPDTRGVLSEDRRRVHDDPTDDHHTLQEFRASAGAQWPFLSDPERIVQKDLALRSTRIPATTP